MEKPSQVVAPKTNKEPSPITQVPTTTTSTSRKMSSDMKLEETISEFENQVQNMFESPSRARRESN